MTIRERVGRRRPPGWMMPQLLPLLVVELVLVLFYLPAFSGNGGECTCFERVPKLPFAHEYADLEAAPLVRIAHGEIRIDGRPMADNDDLVTLKNNFTFLHPDEPWRGSYVLVVDSDMPFGLVARVMRWAEAAGYYQPQYAVQHSFFEDPATQ